MPGSSVSEPAVRFTHRGGWRTLPTGAGKPASGSPTGAAPVTGAGLKVGPFSVMKLPTTRRLPDSTLLVSRAARALLELEFTCTRPGILMLAFPERARAVGAVRFRT